MRVNMRAEHDDPTGILEWTTQAYSLTNSAIRHWDFPAAQGHLSMALDVIDTCPEEAPAIDGGVYVRL